MKKEVPPFGVLAANYDPDKCVIVRSGNNSAGQKCRDAGMKSKAGELQARTQTPEARLTLETSSNMMLNAKRASQAQANSDARASLDRGKKTLSEKTEVKLFDQKSIALAKSTTITTQTTEAECQSSGLNREESYHQLVRRYTEDLDNDRLLLEMERASRKYEQGRAQFEHKNYFDCLTKLSKALECFNTEEPPSESLKMNLPGVYKTVKDCYLLSANCYIRMNQQGHAKNCLKLILKVEPSDAQSLYLRGQANEIRAQTVHQALLDYQRAYELTLKGRAPGSSLRKALEAKLTKIGGPGFCSHIRKQTLGGDDTSQQSSSKSAVEELFEINAEGSSHSRLIKLVTEPPSRRVKNVALIMAAVFLATIFIFVRKRQLIKRLLSAAYRLIAGRRMSAGNHLAPIAAK